jgi:hypothetical protein
MGCPWTGLVILSRHGLAWLWSRLYMGFFVCGLACRGALHGLDWLQGWLAMVWVWLAIIWPLAGHVMSMGSPYSEM